MPNENYKLFTFKLESALVNQGLILPIDPQNPRKKPTPIAISRAGLSLVEFDKDLWSIRYYKIQLENNYTLIFHWLDQFSSQEGRDVCICVMLTRKEGVVQDGHKVGRKFFRYDKNYDWNSFDAKLLVQNLLTLLNIESTFKEEHYQEIKSKITGKAQLIQTDAFALGTRPSLDALDLSQISTIYPKETPSFILLPNIEVHFKGSNARHYFELYENSHKNQLCIRYFVGYYDTKNVIVYYQKDPQSEKMFKFPLIKNSDLELQSLLDAVTTQMGAIHLCP